MKTKIFLNSKAISHPAFKIENCTNERDKVFVILTAVLIVVIITTREVSLRI